MVGGKGSLPPKPKKIEAKPVIKKVEAPPMVGGKGSLPPKKEVKKVEAPKIVKKEAKMDGGSG